MNQLDTLLAVAHEAIDIAVETIMSTPPGEAREKEERDFVSEVDLAVEREVRRFLERRTPHLAFLGEEGTGEVVLNSKNTWALDPLDGTSNFLHGIPLCGVSLGLISEGRPIVGVIALPFLNERYSAAEGHGSFVGTRKIAVTRPGRLSNAIVSIGDYAVGSKSEEKNRARLALSRFLAPKVERVRMFGSAAVDLAWLSAGRTDASIALGNKPWDMAAGVVIAREAGAAVFDRDGSDHTTNSRVTAASSKELVGPILEVLSETYREAESSATS
ncbi:inositol monophosphatase/fructose-1,6-bisphosphatase family protein [Frankia torreyi]|uniref:Inositol-1-monophosphatase n=2 Tax=Frankia TaxID=1854 RepID=A0A0D8B603_9ACTN|nr:MULTISPECIES: inositol monophosphatase family protein [Frankia]KJE19349.1 inositol monophosphatase/fructose-1,6-bisphosphatase family protein [Frankia torreyi]